MPNVTYGVQGDYDGAVLLEVVDVVEVEVVGRQVAVSDNHRAHYYSATVALEQYYLTARVFEQLAELLRPAEHQLIELVLALVLTVARGCKCFLNAIDCCIKAAR